MLGIRTTISKAVVAVTHTAEKNRSITITTLAMSATVLGLTRILLIPIVTYTKYRQVTLI